MAIYENSIRVKVKNDSHGNTRNNWAELIKPVPEDAPKSEKRTKRAKPPKELPQRLFD